MDPKTPSTHNILFTIPRTASHLVTQLLNLPAQPGLARQERDGYFFLAAIRYRFVHDTFTRSVGGWTDEERTGMRDVLQSCFAAWRDGVDTAERTEQSTYIKEHVNWMLGAEEEARYVQGGQGKVMGEEIPRNPTCIPDAFLFHRVTPTFLIRHPALAFPSLLRSALDNEGKDAVLKEASGEVMRWEATFRWHRMLYTFLVASPHYPRSSRDPDVSFPIILDAADLADQGLVKKYAAAVGLDAGVVRFEWEKVREEEWGSMGKMEARMKDTLLKSEGIVVEKLGSVGPLDLEEEKKKWKGEFGETLGQRLVGLVQRAMEDYWWLWEMRMKT